MHPTSSVCALFPAPVLEWLRRPHRARWLWALCAVTPLGLALSNPGALLAAGVALGLISPVARTKRLSAWIPFGGYCLLSVLTVASLQVTFALTARSGPALEGLRQYWALSFLPLTGFPELGLWLITAHTGRCFAYPCGSAWPGQARQRSWWS